MAKYLFLLFGLTGMLAFADDFNVPMPVPGPANKVSAINPSGAAPAVPVSCSRSVTERGAGGAYFRKLVSAPAYKAMGIKAKGILPKVNFDAKRYYKPSAGQPAWQEGSLDRPSVYLGASTGRRELDCGLSWDRVFDSNGNPMYTDLPDMSDGNRPARRFVIAKKFNDVVLKDANGTIIAEGQAAIDKLLAEKKLQPDFAFRPFWRTTNSGGTAWNSPPYNSPKNKYFYPGEKIDMALELKAKNTFILSVKAPGREFKSEFRQDGFDPVSKQYSASFKRVNSIDQFRMLNAKRAGNEGRRVIRTEAKALGASWESVRLILPANTSGGSAYGGRGKEVPMTGRYCSEIRGGDTAPNYKNIFRISGQNERGGESLDIVPK
ncbi:MAG: hypothetical protein NTX59_12955 [Elusimicrobia bacterium]|nr:hypothetical protein [Elusimicrobiota bacterium]